MRGWIEIGTVRVNRYNHRTGEVFGEVLGTGINNYKIEKEKVKEAKRKGRVLDLRRELLCPGDLCETTNLKVGKDSSSYRRKRNITGKIVPTAEERRRRRWERTHMKFTIEWRLYGSFDTGEEEEVVDQDFVDEITEMIDKASKRSGTKDLLQKLAETKDKAEDVRKKSEKKDDWKSFTPRFPYEDIEEAIYDLCENEERFPHIGIFLITECGFDKLCGIFGRTPKVRRRLKDLEDDKSTEKERGRLSREEYKEIRDLLNAICKLEMLDKEGNSKPVIKEKKLIKKEKGAL